MPRVVKGPDGVIRRFPDDATDDEIRAALDSAPAASAQTDGAMARLGRMLSSTGYAAGNAVVGGGKGAVNTVSGLGDLARMIPGVSALDRVMTPIQVNTTPTNAAQKVGYHGEQIAEFFTPTGVAGRLGKIAEIVKAAGLTAAQTGGDPTATGVSALLTGIVPGAKMAKTASAALKQGAQKEMAQALGATKEWAKSEAANLAPEMLKRGVRGSRDAMLSEARGAAQKAGKQLTAAYETAAKAGETVGGDIVRGNIQLTRDALMVKNAAGKRVGIPGTETVLGKLDELDRFVEQLGADIPVDKAAHIKRTWDQIVSKAGLFGPKAVSSATDNANAWALREASNSFRQLLNTNPTIKALNQETAFWTGLKKVLKETQKRTQAQAGTGLVQAGTGGVGAVVGAMSGDSAGERATLAIAGGLAGRQLTKLLQSPAWRTTVTAPMKDQLAKALASGNGQAVSDTVGRIVASLPAQLRPAFTP